jgi:imidazolonepropionase-like amidohydrolase
MLFRRSYLPAMTRHVLVISLATAGAGPAAVALVQVQAQAPAARPPVPGAPPGAIAFVDVNVIPMDTERVLPNQTVLVQNGWISALGPAGQVQVPAGAARIDGRGKYLIPGLGDCHVHIASDTARLFRFLARGVTTVRNMDYMDSEEFKWDSRLALALRARAAAGTLWSPRIYTAGQWAPHPRYNGAAHRFPDSLQARWPEPRPDSVAAYVAAYKAAGFDFIKARREKAVIFDSLAAAARRLGVPIVGHVPPQTTLEQALAGMRTIEHLTGYLPNSPGDHIKRPPIPPDTAGRFRELAAATARAGVWNCATLVATGEVKSLAYLLTKTLQDAGAGLLLGTDDAGARGRKHRPIAAELQALVMKAGLTPYQALVTGTRNMAAYFGTQDETGTIAVNKRADVVLLSANPLDDIRHMAQPIMGVMIGGRWLGREALDRGLASLGIQK